MLFIHLFSHANLNKATVYLRFGYYFCRSYLVTDFVKCHLQENYWKQHAGCSEPLENILDSPLVNEEAHFFLAFPNPEKNYVRLQLIISLDKLSFQ